MLDISKKIIKTITCIFITLSHSSEVAAKFEYQNNNVVMKYTAQSHTLVIGTYTVYDYSISSGQDPDINITSNLEKAFTVIDPSMTYRIGRHPTIEVATWFNSYGDVTNTYNQRAYKLNFAFKGDLQLELKDGDNPNLKGKYNYIYLEDIYLAQDRTNGWWGSYHYNWWFGGKKCKTTNVTGEVKCEGHTITGHPVWVTFEKKVSTAPNNEIEIKTVYYEPFKTYQLQVKYRDEDTSCEWQGDDACLPYVTYYDAEQRETLRITAHDDGLLYYTNGIQLNPYDTLTDSNSYNAIYVIDPNGALYVSQYTEPYRFHHSSFLSGADVAAAGEMKVKNGKIIRIRNCSGHYQPSTDSLYVVKEVLFRMGYEGGEADGYFIYDEELGCH